MDFVGFRIGQALGQLKLNRADFSPSGRRSKNPPQKSQRQRQPNNTARIQIPRGDTTGPNSTNKITSDTTIISHNTHTVGSGTRFYLEYNIQFFFVFILFIHGAILLRSQRVYIVHKVWQWKRSFFTCVSLCFVFCCCFLLKVIMHAFLALSLHILLLFFSRPAYAWIAVL